MNGIINLLKPPCLSSAQAVSFVKRLTGQKTGHAGTLDPEACGVLPVMVGKATALFDYIAEHHKMYVAEIAFGTATDTQDATGRVIDRGTDYPNADRLRSVIDRFKGDVLQVPPQYSALKRDGKPMYELARAGQAPELSARTVNIESIHLLEERPGHAFLLRVFCGKGTYIRTLCHEIGKLAGCPAHMRLLIREQTGPFRIENAITMEEFEHAVNRNGQYSPWLLSMEDAVRHLPQLVLNAALWKPCVNGVALEPDEALGGKELLEGETAVLYCRNTMIGLYERRAGKLRIKTMLLDMQNTDA